MSWVRLDDEFPNHPKVAQLTDRQFRIHIRVLCYCSRFSKDGAVSPAMFKELPGLTQKMGERFVELGVWDALEDGSLLVHDFKEYGPKDPTAAERSSRYRRNKNRDADRDATVTQTDLSNGSRHVSPGTGKALLKSNENAEAEARAFLASKRDEVLARGGESA